MSLSQGRPLLSIPGPSVMPDRVLNAMHRPAPNIYAGELPDAMPEIIAGLKAVACTSQNVAIYIGNGHAAWEAASTNLFSRGDKALSLLTGHFGVGWAAQMRDLGVLVDVMDFGRQAPLDPAVLEAALKADTAQSYKVVVVTHVDTATGVLNDVAAVRRAMDAAGHPALLVVDCVASMGCDRLEFDAWGVDVAVSASQKGLMVPPGLGFVWVSDKAIERCAGADLRTPYWDWTVRARATEFWEYFGGTAPTHHLFGLREALKMLVQEEGMENVWARHKTFARAVWAAFDAWGLGGSGIALNVADPAARACSVTTAAIPAPDATRLRAWCEAEAGVTLGIGLGMGEGGGRLSDGHLRVGHMGHLNPHMILGTLAVMEAGMIALEIPHGSGGVVAAARVIAGK